MIRRQAILRKQQMVVHDKQQSDKELHETNERLQKLAKEKAHPQALYTYGKELFVKLRTAALSSKKSEK